MTRADRLEDRHGSDHHPLVLEFAFDNATMDSSTPPGPALAELSAELHVTTEVAQTSDPVGTPGPDSGQTETAGEKNRLVWDSVHTCAEVHEEIQAALGSYVYGPLTTDVDICGLERDIDQMEPAAVRAQFSTEHVPLDQDIDFSPALIAEVMSTVHARSVRDLLKHVSDHVFDTAHGGNLSRMGLNKEVQRRIADS
eukprot:COSAG06_NODE_24718_length_654_cov_1.180180_2_plen_196_part_01